MYKYILCLALFSAVVVHDSTAAVDFSQPVNATEYHKIIKQGFATNYFKSSNGVKNRFKYNTKNVQDVYNRGFRNLRLRVRPRLYDTPYADDLEFSWFLGNLTKVVDDCIDIGPHHLVGESRS